MQCVHSIESTCWQHKVGLLVLLSSASNAQHVHWNCVVPSWFVVKLLYFIQRIFINNTARKIHGKKRKKLVRNAFDAQQIERNLILHSTERVYRENASKNVFINWRAILRLLTFFSCVVSIYFVPDFISSWNVDLSHYIDARPAHLSLTTFFTCFFYWQFSGDR